MTWKKFFKTTNLPSTVSPLGNGHSSISNVSYRNYQSSLPEVYVGHPNRTERYAQYNAMDGDSEVNAALDILAEFCTQKNRDNNTAFSIHFKDKPTDNEVNIIREQLQQWVALNEFNKRIFKIFRNVLKYGDQVFIRDPETFKLFWTEMEKVTKVIVDETAGKKPEQYVIKDINPNFQNLTVTAVSTSDTYSNNPQNGGAGGGGYIQSGAPFHGGSRFTHQHNEAVINAEHVVHVSLTEGLDAFWPFGTSVLENVFKVFKQKELLEDAIIIYRVQRAPERRVFKIDVGNMPTHMAMAFVERIKNEVAQRRIPTQTGGGCFAMDTTVPLLDGRTLTIAELSDEFNRGKTNWAYSCNPTTGAMVPGLISWAGVTQESAEVIELLLDNGEKIICTPEHKFPIKGKGFVEAQNIKPNEDNLISFNAELGIDDENIKTDPQYQQVVSITKLNKKIQVGTLTIDKDEIHHNYHTFAISQGVFTKNSNMMDATYSPISTNEDFFFPVTADGRGSSVEPLPGGSNLGEITDLRFFTNKLFRGLRIPSSYLPTGTDEGTQSFNDGRTGTALIQEWRFNQYCKRLQNMIVDKLDQEFKMFMRWRGINIDSALFDLIFEEPQNFAQYAQSDADQARITTFTSLEQYPYFSKRWLMKRYLGLSEQEMNDNEQQWNEEQGDVVAAPAESADLRAVGITPGGLAGDLDSLASVPGEEMGGVEGNLEAPAAPAAGGGLPTPPTNTPPAAEV